MGDHHPDTISSAGQHDPHRTPSRQPLPPRSAALKFVLLVGVMSFFADFTYEGSRSIIDPYLGLLGAGVLAIAMVTGAGEPLGYGLRLFSLRLWVVHRHLWHCLVRRKYRRRCTFQHLAHDSCAVLRDRRTRRDPPHTPRRTPHQSLKPCRTDNLERLRSARGRTPRCADRRPAFRTFASRGRARVLLPRFHRVRVLRPVGRRPARHRLR